MFKQTNKQIACAALFYLFFSVVIEKKYKTIARATSYKQARELYAKE